MRLSVHVRIIRVGGGTGKGQEEQGGGGDEISMRGEINPSSASIPQSPPFTRYF